MRLLRVGGRDVWMSWEDVALVIMGPRANKTSALAVPDRAVRPRPGRRHLQQGRPVGAHRRAARPGRAGVDVRPASHRPRRADLVVGPAAGDPRRRPDAHRYEAAARLAGHFMATIGGTRRDPFFHAAGEQVLIGTLLAAALSGGTMRDVLAWLQYGRRTRSPRSTAPAPASRPPTSKPASAAPTSPPKASTRPPAPPPKP